MVEAAYLGHGKAGYFPLRIYFLLMTRHFAIIASTKEFPMNEIFFLVEEASEGGYAAKALGESIFTEADTLEELHANVRDAVRCHFDEGKAPKMIRLLSHQAFHS
ncbi:MAG TPA: hypothetical protein VI298_18245 [Geobacteraceae bacterium]